MGKKTFFALMGIVVLISISSVAYHRANAAANHHTRLLFSYVSNEAGFDTGISISNTSMDPFKTAKESGTCILYFYSGGSLQHTYTPPEISAGFQWTSLASEIDPGFQGYVIADCDFHYAHGMAYLVDNATHSASIYPAQVLTVPRPAYESSGE